MTTSNALLALTFVSLPLLALLLLLVEKIIRLEGRNYKQSLIVLLTSFCGGLLLSLPLSALHLNTPLSIICVLLVGVIIFIMATMKRFNTSFLKALGIYALYQVFLFAATLLIVLPTRLFLIQPFVTTGISMSPTYNEGDYLIINKFDHQYHRSDVIVLHHPPTEQKYLIKRIVGLPGEQVEIKNNEILIDGVLFNEPHFTKIITGDPLSVTLGDSEYFVLGDNLPLSFDSRHFGAVKKESIVGKISYSFPKK